MMPLARSRLNLLRTLVRSKSNETPKNTLASSQLPFPCIDQHLQRHEQLVSRLNSSCQPALPDNTKSELPFSDNNDDASIKELIKDKEMWREPVYAKVVMGFKTFKHSEPFDCQLGGRLNNGFQLAYETWGALNDSRDNALLVHTGLSASSHAKSHNDNQNPGWWESFIGPGLALDTDKYHVICTNVLGSCYGSTGSSSIDQDTNLPYATTFPVISIFDMVRAQFLLLDHLNIKSLHASVGSSMGGMQSLAASALFPDRVRRCVSISACARSHPYSIALRHTQRAVLMSDKYWCRGRYYPQFGPLSDQEKNEMGLQGNERVPPHVGMKLARMIATIGYRSGPEWEMRFGRRKLESSRPGFCPEYLIESYLDHQGEKFCLQYDPNSLLYVSKAMDLFDMSVDEQDNEAMSLIPSTQSPTQAFSSPAESPRHESMEIEQRRLIKGLSRIKCPVLVLGVQSDILFPVAQQKEIAIALRQRKHPEPEQNMVTYYELDSIFGHDTFLMDVANVGAAIKGHLDAK